MYYIHGNPFLTFIQRANPLLGVKSKDRTKLSLLEIKYEGIGKIHFIYFQMYYKMMLKIHQ